MTELDCDARPKWVSESNLWSFKQCDWPRAKQKNTNYFTAAFRPSNQRRCHADRPLWPHFTPYYDTSHWKCNTISAKRTQIYPKCIAGYPTAHSLIVSRTVLWTLNWKATNFFKYHFCRRKTKSARDTLNGTRNERLHRCRSEAALKSPHDNIHGLLLCITHWDWVVGCCVVLSWVALRLRSIFTLRLIHSHSVVRSLHLSINKKIK